MSRRVLTLLLATLSALALALVASVAKVPYVEEGPGPAFDTLGAVGGIPVISITGRPTFPTDGHLDATTVSVRDDINLAQALQGWLSNDIEVVPRDAVFPPNQTTKQNDQQGVQQMQESQDNATTAALRLVGVPPTTTDVVATSVTDGSPADGKLKPGDVLVSVNGVPVTSTEALRHIISTRPVGSTVRIAFRRGDTSGAADLTTAASDDATPHSVVGIVLEERFTFPVKVAISLKDVGGPSAGLMFALGILDKLGADSLTGGRNIAGTGEITADGTVGPIGGIGEKLIGARRRGATVFLVPAANCAEARGRKPASLKLVKVTSLADALTQLGALRAGRATAPC